MVGLVFLISIPSNSSTTIKNKENPWSYCYSDDLRFLQSKKEGRGISVFLYTRCTEQKYKLLINYSDYEESTFCLSQISQVFTVIKDPFLALHILHTVHTLKKEALVKVVPNYGRT